MAAPVVLLVLHASALEDHDVVGQKGERRGRIARGKRRVVSVDDGSHVGVWSLGDAGDGVHGNTEHRQEGNRAEAETCVHGFGLLQGCHEIEGGDRDLENTPNRVRPVVPNKGRAHESFFMFSSHLVHHEEVSFSGTMPSSRSPMTPPHIVARRDFLRIASTVAAGTGVGLRPTSLFASVSPGGDSVPDTAEFELIIDRDGFRVDDRSAHAPMIGGTIPGPLLRFREGQEVVMHVTNRLDEVTSLHWHGLLVPFEQDGVPGFSYDGIAPGETFTYRFPVQQAGSYWYHSHSGTQEQEGMYAPIIIDPAGEDPVAYDREYSILLSDWTSENPIGFAGGVVFLRVIEQDADAEVPDLTLVEGSAVKLRTRD